MRFYRSYLFWAILATIVILLACVVLSAAEVTGSRNTGQTSLNERDPASSQRQIPLAVTEITPVGAGFATFNASATLRYVNGARTPWPGPEA